jgi:hypothetical protein
VIAGEVCAGRSSTRTLRDPEFKANRFPAAVLIIAITGN